MTSGLKRYYGKRDLHFVTFSCDRRMRLLISADARDLFVGELARIRGEHGFRLAGYVIMPEHVHLLIGEPSKGTVSTVLQVLKQRVSRKMLQARRELARQQIQDEFPAEGKPVFWAARFYDFNVYSFGKVQEKLNYMHANPVIRKLVEHPKDWLWSSWASYHGGERELISIDDLGPAKTEEMKPTQD